MVEDALKLLSELSIVITEYQRGEKRAGKIKHTNVYSNIFDGIKMKIKETEAGIAACQETKYLEFCALVHTCQGERDIKHKSIARDLIVKLLYPAKRVLAKCFLDFDFYIN